MALLNYTTKVPVKRTVAEMQDALVGAGAASVMADYEAGHPVGLTFTIPTAHGTRAFSLPVGVGAVEKLLADDRTVDRRYHGPEQAERVAWRILKDWLEAQLALIATQMVTLDQVMLPYMQTDELGTTVWQTYQENAMRALPAGP